VTQPKTGFLYVVKPKFKDGPFKIGIASDLKKRLEALQTSHYEDLEVLMVIEMSNPRELEKALHKRFREYRIRGEWFAANRELYEALLALPGICTPLWMRDMKMLPNRPWHATRFSTETAHHGGLVNWPKWDEAGALAI
jgi:hypothetical protein